MSRWIKDETDCQFKNGVRKNWTSVVSQISSLVESCLSKNPFLTATDLIKEVQVQFGKLASEATVSRCRRHVGYKYKMATRTHEHQRVSPSHPFLLANKYPDAIAIDEASFVSCDRPRRGWAKFSSRVPKHPPKQRNRISLLLAIDTSGVVTFEIKKGAFNKESYSSFQQKLPSDRTLILDNVAFHKSHVTKEAELKRNIELVYIPPYCPWFNPVECAFSVAKATYRKSRSHDHPDFVSDVVSCLQKITSEDCQSFFSHSARLRQNEIEKLGILA